MKFTGIIDHAHRVDPARPFVLSIDRHLIDGRGRPMRGLSVQYTYDNREAAVADLRAAQKAKLKPWLRDFSDLDNVKVIP